MVLNHGKMIESVVNSMLLLFLNPVVCLFISLIISFMQTPAIPLIVPLLCSLVFASLAYIVQERKYIVALALFYLLLCCIFKEFFCYLPIVVYMVIQRDVYKPDDLFFLIPFIFHLQDVSIYVLFCIMAATIFSIGLKVQYLKSEYLKQDYQKQRDATQELALVLSTQNRDLMIQQEQEIRIATLDERNRIAREIHDNVGHLLSSSLLQIGAIQVMENNDVKKENLSSLRDTISIAMDSIRNSVHDLHIEAMDLNRMIQKLISGFTFCPVEFEYDVIHPFKQEVIYHLAAIISECLNNTIKHSNATKMSILVREQPSFYQIIIHDNGTRKEKKEGGIGLENIRERIDDLKGYVNISESDGFRIFITVPKEEEICAC